MARKSLIDRLRSVNSTQMARAKDSLSRCRAFPEVTFSSASSVAGDRQVRHASLWPGLVAALQQLFGPRTPQRFSGTGEVCIEV